MGFIFAHVVAINPTVVCSHTGTSINLYVCIDNTQSDRGSTVPFSLLFFNRGITISRQKFIVYSVALLFLPPYDGFSISRHNFYVNASIPTTGAIHHSNHKICDSNRIRKLFAICDFNRIHEPSEF
jgi:hypothetical protein